MAITQSAAPLKGLDLGTSRIVLANLSGETVDYTPQLNAFIDLPYAKSTEMMLISESILHRVEDTRIYAYGNRADEFAKFLEGDARRPMQSGVLNSAEPKNLQMIELLIERLCGKAVEGDKICFNKDYSAAVETAKFTITGGTGKYEGASGSGHFKFSVLSSPQKGSGTITGSLQVP